MSTDAAQHNGVSPQVLEARVERNREELARTVDALHRKLDVKAQARKRADKLKQNATTDSGKPRPELVAAAGAAVLSLVLLTWWRRRD
jgi:MYXO-CTERM domain-containing protein